MILANGQTKGTKIDRQREQLTKGTIDRQREQLTDKGNN